MSELIELMTFFAFILNSIFSILENTTLSGYSILDIVCSMGYISITFWGVFSILNPNDNNVEE